MIASVVGWVVGNPLKFLGIIGAIAVVGYIGVLKWENSSLEAQNAKSRIEIANLVVEKKILEGSVDTLKTEIELTLKAQEVLEKSIETMIKRNELETTDLKEIENAPESEDGPVAPVLERAIERLRQRAEGTGR